MKQITIEQYFGDFPYNDELHRSADELLLKINSLLSELGLERKMNSGYRTREYNLKVGGAPNSTHCLAKAIDLDDGDRRLGGKLIYMPMLLIKRGLHIEDPSYTRTKSGGGWVHLQSIAPRSGKTIYQPYAGPPILR